jgi:chromosome transmission fidelity protein 1
MHKVMFSQVLIEPQDSAQVEAVLHEYAVHAAKKVSLVNCRGHGMNMHLQKGALLLAVIGAKLSEGLNFSDDLARAVAIVGLPFANIQSPEVQERMKYANKLKSNRGASKDAGAELYENMCMSAVNQSIGKNPNSYVWSGLLLIQSHRTSHPA